MHTVHGLDLLNASSYSCHLQRCETLVKKKEIFKITVQAVISMLYLGGFSKLLKQQRSDIRNLRRLLLGLEECVRKSVDYPCLAVCLPKCFLVLASRAWPQLFPSHRRIPVQTKGNIADEQMCFKNGRGTRRPLLGEFTHRRGSWRMRTGLDVITQGALLNTWMSTHVQTHQQRYPKTCTHPNTLTQL